MPNKSQTRLQENLPVHERMNPVAATSRRSRQDPKSQWSKPRRKDH